LTGTGLDRPYRRRACSGCFSIRLNIAGTSWLCVTRYRPASRRYGPGSNFSMMTTVPPWRMARLTAACGAG
jgi:hypothetical protein